MQYPLQDRLSGHAGVAIGSLLFTIAILVILTTAIVAGSSRFDSDANIDRANNAANLLQIGKNLKMGVDRVMARKTALAGVVINPVNTVNAVDLFAPAGGGLVVPSSDFSLNGDDPWIYTYGAVTGLGTAEKERLALLKVAPGVCEQVNKQASNAGTIAADMGKGVDGGANITAVWPEGLQGRTAGCVENINPGAKAHYFYQVLGVQ
jgi:hypothetical protein